MADPTVMDVIWAQKRFTPDSAWESFLKGLARGLGRPAPLSRGDRERQAFNDQMAIEQALEERERRAYEKAIRPPVDQVLDERKRALENVKRTTTLKNTDEALRRGLTTDEALRVFDGDVLTREQRDVNLPALDRAVDALIPSMFSQIDTPQMGIENQEALPDGLQLAQKSPENDATKFVLGEQPDFGYMDSAAAMEKAIQDAQAKEAFPVNRVLAGEDPMLKRYLDKGLNPRSPEAQAIMRRDLGAQIPADFDREANEALEKFRRNAEMMGKVFDEQILPQLTQHFTPQEIANARAQFMVSGRLPSLKAAEEDSQKLNQAQLMYLSDAIRQWRDFNFDQPLTPEVFNQFLNEARSIGAQSPAPPKPRETAGATSQPTAPLTPEEQEELNQINEDPIAQKVLMDYKAGIITGSEAKRRLRVHEKNKASIPNRTVKPAELSETPATTPSASSPVASKLQQAQAEYSRLAEQLAGKPMTFYDGRLMPTSEVLKKKADQIADMERFIAERQAELARLQSQLPLASPRARSAIQNRIRELQRMLGVE